MNTQELKEVDEQLKCFALKSTSRHPERNMKPLPWPLPSRCSYRRMDPAMIHHARNEVWVINGRRGHEAEGAPLKPFSSSAAIAKRGAKRAIKAKALIDLMDEKPGECAQSYAVSALPSNNYIVDLNLDECGSQISTEEVLLCKNFPK